MSENNNIDSEGNLDLRHLEDDELPEWDDMPEAVTPVAFVCIAFEDEETGKRKAVVASGLEEDVYDRALALLRQEDTGIAWGVTIRNGGPLTDEDERVAKHGDVYLVIRNEDEVMLISGLYPSDNSVMDEMFWFAPAGRDEDDGVEMENEKSFSVSIDERFLFWAAKTAFPEGQRVRGRQRDEIKGAEGIVIGADEEGQTISVHFGPLDVQEVAPGELEAIFEDEVVEAVA